MMKKVKGIVLESTIKNVILLTAAGEYRRLPARGRLYPLGTEVEVRPALLPVNHSVFAAAAAVLLFMAITLLWQTAIDRPSAYLALDINPSILLSLDKDTTVIEVETINDEGEALSKGLALKGLPADTALELILQEAGLRGYLSGGRENMVFLTLAAPPGYGLDEMLLQQSVSHQLLFLEVDSYLKVSTTTPEAAREARQKEISLNAVLLAEELAHRGLLPLAEDKDGQERDDTEAVVAVNVQKLLEQVLPQHVFTEKEFIAGGSAKTKEVSPGRPPDFTPPGQSKEPGPPHIPPGQDKEPGPPESSPGQVKEPGPPDFTPPGQSKEPGPPHIPPGQDKEPGPPESSPGQVKEPGPPDFIPPGQDKENGPTDSTPPGQDKKTTQPHNPPGQVKENGPFHFIPPGWNKILGPSH